MNDKETFLIADFFWNEKFWLPENLHWDDFDPGEVANANFFYTIILFAVGILVLRYLVKNQISIPLGKSLGLKEKVVNQNENNNNAELERLFQLFGKELQKQADLGELEKQGLGNEKEVARWLRKRIAQDKPTDLEKFAENHWSVLWYTFLSVYAIYNSWDQPYFWDLNECWTNFTSQTVPQAIKWHITFGISYNLTMICIQFYLPRKKDHWQLVTHHVVSTIGLSVAYIQNTKRMVSLILLTHDVSDVFVHFCKSCSFAKKDKLLMWSLPVFVVMWIGTRLIIFPRLIYSVAFGEKGFHIFPAMVVTLVILMVLLILHCIWTFYLYKTITRIVIKKKVPKDARSGSEDSD